MEGSEYNIEKMHSDLTKMTNAQPGDKIFQALNTCINESKLHNHVIYNITWLHIYYIYYIYNTSNLVLNKYKTDYV